MNKTIKLAVAGAVLSAASIANAGIIIPAGEWTMDINGNVNMFATMTKADDTASCFRRYCSYSRCQLVKIHTSQQVLAYYQHG